MPIMNRNERIIGNNSTGQQAISISKSRRKAPGTRLGTLEDWRQASGKSGRTPGYHGHGVRDGR